MLKVSGRVRATGLVVTATTAAVLLGAVVQAGAASTSSDSTGGFIVFPKVIVRPADLVSGEPGIDTLIQLTNTGPDPVWVQCYYVNANGRCGSATDPDSIPCWTEDDCEIEIECDQTTNTCGGVAGGQTCSFSEINPCPPVRQACVPDWNADRDFTFRLTREQPIGWSADTGLVSGSLDLPCENQPCSETNQGNNGRVLGVGDPIFRGELKCVQLDGTGENPGNPAVANHLKGEATIVRGGGGSVELDASAYNATAFFADTAGTDRSGGALCLGTKPAGETAACSVNYSPCSNVLVVKHFFDGAILPVDNASVSTRLTVVPCSEDLSGLPEDPAQTAPPIIRGQILVFNEFEQRFSGDLDVECYRDTLLSDIDTVPGTTLDNRYSIFSFAVQGTLTGQTRLRGVPGLPAAHGVGLLAVTQEEYSVPERGIVASAAYNVHMDSGMSRGDVVKIRDRE